jgi:hypothetical protein
VASRREPTETSDVDRRRLEELERGLEQARARNPDLPAPLAEDRKQGREQSVPPAYHPADEHQTVFAFMGGSSRRGSWEPAARVDCTAIMGGVNIDLREADLIEGTTTIRCFALWGGINIIVPPDVDVDAAGTGILGAFEHVDQRALEESEGAPVPLVRVEGLALMGGVSIRVKERKKPKRK